MKKTVGIIIAVLVLVVGVTAYLNRDYVKDRQVMIENYSFAIKNQEEEVVVDLEWIETLGPVEFKADLNSSGNDPVEHSYTGVPLKEVIVSKDISLEDKRQVIIRSVDGYTVALSAEEVLEEDNVYIVYKQNGEALGTKEDGGSGPYQVILRKDAFSQRWAKFVVEVELQ